MEKDEKWFEKKMDRREFLKKAGIGGAGLALGVSGASAFFANKVQKEKNLVVGDEKISFYGKHQAGITTPMQRNIYFVVLDLISTDRSQVIEMFKSWTDYSQKLVDGQVIEKDSSNVYLPPNDTGEAVGLNPYRLTLTFGVSHSFLKKMKLEKKKPKAFRELPPFPREILREKYTGGDIVIQACADDEQVAFHAVRNLIKNSRRVVAMRWSQSGFAAIGDRMETPRNLFGFKDGTANDTTEKRFDEVVWADEAGWMKGGSYMAVRRIQMFLDTWDRTSLKEQENTFGRYKDSGAPLGQKNEFDPVDLDLKDEEGEPVIPLDAHVRLAKEAGVPIFRRSYSYSSGIDDVTGQFDTGLLFIAFQKTPEQFIKIQTNLGNDDKMNEYVSHIGSGLFACFAGVQKGEYLGQKLFE
ncbi:iron uptake transporter deferrochelatase/peroxidase subunit [Streptococcus oricebi]|uniref:Deferrochelatase n=1 Tax=Streptococcus oricebi TaxID=1547447 RepID=A0ABS5B0J7_9STRE|nr:iron uptake transporter deferrochelatase/peroxidase subunit [Streptococcus oricebi]MBP2622352.1 deferrochelatase/peroxidase EfeB [Streptococcus oricebi]